MARRRTQSALAAAGIVGAALLLTRGRDRSDWPDSTAPPAPDDARARVVAAARGELGSRDSAKYWASALPGVNTAGLDWCGAFALWCLHEAGLALGWEWEIGVGFLLTNKHRLPTTSTPAAGDIAYFTKNQHEAVVLSVDDVGRTVELANGNGAGGAVTLSTATWASAAAFFSIEPLILEA